MKMNSFWAMAGAYGKRRVKTIMVFCTFTIIFAVVLSLYSLPLDAVLYAALLSASFAIILIIYDFWKYYQHHHSLEELMNRITVHAEDLPTPHDLIEQDYQNLLTCLYQDKVRIASEADIRQTEMVDYYTLWAHQIKTPISAMRLLLQSEQTEQNAELSLELFKIEQYVEMVLQYLRLESTSSDLVLQRYSLADIVKQAVRKYAKVFILKKITLDFQEMDCMVLTDEKWLEFVIEQILSNALKYTPNGAIFIYMDPHAEKTMVIEDTGIGIQQEDLPRVFEKGFTGYNGRMDKKSTGIGLYLCKRILKKLSHTIIITSETGMGTKVKIDLTSADTFTE